MFSDIDGPGLMFEEKVPQGNQQFSLRGSDVLVFNWPLSGMFF